MDWLLVIELAGGGAIVGLVLGIWIAGRLLGAHAYDEIITNAGFDYNGFRYRVTRTGATKEK